MPPPLRKPFPRLREVLRLSALALVLVLVTSAAARPGGAQPAGGERIPFVVKVLTESDNGLGSMKLADMAKLVAWMFASGAPAGTYAAAHAAGIKTVWYEDPHRIGDVPGHMSDHPPITDLRKDRDLMRCARGGLLDATYADANGTYFGDPTSTELIRRSRNEFAKAVAHYGPVDYLWLDDAILLTDEWAEAWFCGNSPPALTKNGGNGMTAIGHGFPPPSDIAYAGGAAYTAQNYLEHLAAFDDAMPAPVLDEGACVGDGTPLGGGAEDPGSTAALVVAAQNASGALCENFAEGWGNRQTLNGKAVDQYWKSDLNSGIRVLSAHKTFVVYPYIGNEGSTNRGSADDYDQRGYIEASYLLLFDYEHAIYKTGMWGAHLGVKAPVMVLPENLLVPTRPLRTAVWPQHIDALRNGGAYVREFAQCGFAGRPIGPCAAVVNPSSSATVSMPPLQQTYHHAIAFTGNNGAFTGRHGTPDYGDTGDIDFTSRPVPASLPPAGWAILGR